VGALPLIGCEASTAADAESEASALSTFGTADIAPGAGRLDFGQFGNNSNSSFHYQSTTGGDEFVRVGQKLTIGVTFRQAYCRYVERCFDLRGSDAQTWKDLFADPSKLEMSVIVVFVRTDGSTEEARFPITWLPDTRARDDMRGEVSFDVSTKLSKLVVTKFAVKVPSLSAVEKVELVPGAGQLSDLSVIGGDVPNKMALFDTNGGTLRARILEGGALNAGAKVRVAYSDWRVDTIVDYSKLDRYVGKRTSQGRFGTSIVPVYGQIEYEVSAAVSVDGRSFSSVSFQPESRSILSDLSGERRIAYQSTIDTPPSGSAAVETAFNIKVFLVVPNGELIDPKYAPGSRVLIKEVWDNNGGANYKIPVGSPSR